MDIEEQVSAWVDMIADLFKIELDVPGLIIPASRSDFEQMIVVPSGLSLTQVIEVCRKKFGSVYCFERNIDQFVRFNARLSNESHVVWVGPSSDVIGCADLAPAICAQVHTGRGITLLERLLLELKHFRESGGHLDVDTLTLCTGSLNVDNTVPYVCWNRRTSELRVNWLDVDQLNDAVRLRSVLC